jgi:hypothetical protein
MVATMADTPPRLGGAETEKDTRYGLTTSSSKLPFIKSLHGGSTPPLTA